MFENVVNAIVNGFKGIAGSNTDTGISDTGSNLDSIKNKDEIIQFVNDEFSRRQDERLPFELQWRENIDFLNGLQHVKINTYTKDIENIDTFSWWEEREVFDQLSPILETRLAKLNRLSNKLKVRPATGDSEDISSAKVSMKLLESTAMDQHIDELQKEANTWAEKTGSAIWKITWNPNKGRVIGMVASNVSLDNTDTKGLEGDSNANTDTIQSNKNMKVLHEGNIDTMVVSPFEIYPDNIFHSKINRCRSLIHAKVYNVNDIYDSWHVVVKGEKCNVFSLKGGTVSAGGMGQKGLQYTIATAEVQNSALVLEYWETPSSNYPNGRLIICTKDTLLYVGEMPYMLGEYGEREMPFIVQKSLETEYFFGKSVIDRLIPLQRRYNSLKNRVKEYLNRATIGNLAYEEGSIDEDMYEDEGIAPGQMIPYKKGFNAPAFLSTPPLPATFTQEYTELKQDFINISGISEISRDSSAPVGTGSGIALSILQEQDNTRISLTASYINDTRIGVGKIQLKLLKQYVQYPRVLKDVGKNDTIETLEWSGDDITSYDVYIESASELSETPAQRRQMVMDLFSAGLFNNPDTGRIDKETRSKIFDLLQMGNWEMFDDDDNLHLQKAVRENRLMLQGQLPQVVQYDDDLCHIAKHNNFRLTADYEEFIASSPQVAQIFEQHIQQHFQSLQAKNPPQQQVQEPSQSISYKDLPPEGQVQLAAKAGIQITPQNIMQQSVNQQAQQPLQTQQPKINTGKKITLPTGEDNNTQVRKVNQGLSNMANINNTNNQ